MHSPIFVQVGFPLSLGFLLAPYFDNDAFMHNALHELEASA